jgi:probable HAF family extracellular repeat protein
MVGGMNVAGDQAFHPYLWDGQSLRDLGTLGGDFGISTWINEAGDVVGWTLTGGNQMSHAFLWRKGILNDLGTVDGDPNSIAFSINSEEQVVGASQDNNFANVHAFLWERGSIADLNKLIAPSTASVRLNAAVGLNERGEIVAQGMLSSGNQHAFLLIPCDENHPGVEGCDYNMVHVRSAVLQTSPALSNASSSTLPQSLMRRMNRYRFAGAVSLRLFKEM